MFSDQPNFYNPSSHHQNPPPLFTLQDSSSFFVQHETQLPLTSHQLPHEKNVMILPSPEEKQVPSVRRLRNLGTIPRRKPGKKDRHSKICTAQGIRDRRMRLSVQIARKFFDLQDMLGYDKASKTIEWLFANSDKAINELIKDHPQYDEDGEEEEGENPEGGFKPDVVRVALREKARARARWRTREKMMIRNFEGSASHNGTEPSNPSFDEYVLDQKLGFVDDQRGSSLNNQERVSNVYGDVGTIEKLIGSSSMACPSSNCQNRSVMDSDMDPNSGFMAFFGSWEMLKVPCAVVHDRDSLGEKP